MNHQNIKEINYKNQFVDEEASELQKNSFA